MNLNAIEKPDGVAIRKAFVELKREVEELRGQMTTLVNNNTIVLSSDIPRVDDINTLSVSVGTPAWAWLDRGAGSGDRP